MKHLLAMILLLALNIHTAASNVCSNGYNGNCSTEVVSSCTNGTTCLLDDIDNVNSSGKCCINGDLSQDPTVCTEPKDIGPCEASFQRYFYNIKNGQCEKFTWGGCNPNGNNFLSEEHCNKVCGNICLLPRKKGSCKSKAKRWYYDTYDCQCKKFSYSGCQGNENRFSSKKECENACGNTFCRACSVEKKIGLCKAAIPRFYYDTKKGKCQGFIWGGCQPNENNFATMKACNMACKTHVCTLPKTPGPCKRAVQRFYFDGTTNECKEFIWGGCKSNGNNFKSVKACKAKCKPKRKSRT